MAGNREGIEQRARLLERGERLLRRRRLIRQGDSRRRHYGSPSFCIRCIIAAARRKISQSLRRDLAAGGWALVVLGDRTQAPSGAGYALANRLGCRAPFQSLTAILNVERLAPFSKASARGSQLWPSAAMRASVC